MESKAAAADNLEDEKEKAKSDLVFVFCQIAYIRFLIFFFNRTILAISRNKISKAVNNKYQVHAESDDTEEKVGEGGVVNTKTSSGVVIVNTKLSTLPRSPTVVTKDPSLSTSLVFSQRKIAQYLV